MNMYGKTIYLLSILFGSVLQVLISPSAQAIVITADGGEPGHGVDVRTRWTPRNETGRTANDIHIEIYQGEQGVRMMGASVGGDAITGGSGSLGERDNQPANDGNNHQANFDLTINDVEPGDFLDLSLKIRLNKENVLRIDDYWWTFDGENIGGTVGGGGGNGGGGGTDKCKFEKWGWSIASPNKRADGNWSHAVSFLNLSECKDMQINEFKLGVSMNYIDDLTTWQNSLSVMPIITTPFTLAAGSVYTYDLITAESYLGGHVYGMISYDDPIYIWLDYPVDSIDANEPATMSIFGFALMWLFRRWKQIRPTLALAKFFGGRV